MFKRLKLFSLVGLLASGCDYADFNPETNCVLPGFKSLQAEGRRDCDCLVKNFIYGRELLEEFVIIPRGLDFSNVSIKIFIEKEDLFENKGLYGQYDLYNENPEIYLTYDGRSFVHELLHHYEINYLGVSLEDSNKHLNWTEKRFDQASYGFRNRVSKENGHYCN